MPDPRFYPVPDPASVAELAERFGLVCRGDGHLIIANVAPLHMAGPDELSFVAAKKHLDAALASRAGALVVAEALSKTLEGRTVLVADDPQRAFAAISRAFHPDPPLATGVSASADIDPTAQLDDGVAVGPGALIGPGVEIGANCQIGPGAVIGAGVVLGPGCRIGARASLRFAVLGARVRVFAGAVIGEDGFGFVAGAAGLEKIPQLGRVVIGDDVEVGANTTIDRGAGDDTVIGPGTKIDNLVQIAHNCRIGAHCVIVSQTGVAGSVTIGDGAQLGGKAAISDHLTIGAGARIAGKAGVTRDVDPGATVAGFPAVPVRDWHRQGIVLSQMARKTKG